MRGAGKYAQISPFSLDSKNPKLLLTCPRRLTPMFHTLSKLLFAAALSVACLAAPALAAPAPGTPQYSKLTTRSLPEMLQQGGLQVQSLTDNAGPYWIATNPQNNMKVMIE